MFWFVNDTASTKIYTYGHKHAPHESLPSYDRCAAVVERHPGGERVFEVPEAALNLVRLDLKVRNRGLELRIPVHEALVAVDQPLFVEVDEYLAHRAGEMRVHRELFARPVHRAAEAAELAGDLAAAFSSEERRVGDEVVSTGRYR